MSAGACAPRAGSCSCAVVDTHSVCNTIVFVAAAAAAAAAAVVVAIVVIVMVAVVDTLSWPSPP